MTQPIPAKYVRINDSFYRFNHGAPKGQGWWGFAVEGHQNDSVMIENNPFWFTAKKVDGRMPTYGEAKKQAIKWAAANGHYSLIVLC